MKEHLLQQIGQRIREVRQEKGLLQGAVAKEFGCGQTRISAIEHGSRDPGVDFLTWFSQRTGVSTDYILLGREKSDHQELIIEHINEFVVKRANKLLKMIASSDDFADEIESSIKKQFPTKAPGCYWLTGDELDVISLIRSLPEAEKHLTEFISTIEKTENTEG